MAIDSPKGIGATTRTPWQLANVSTLADEIAPCRDVIRRFVVIDRPSSGRSLNLLQVRVTTGKGMTFARDARNSQQNDEAGNKLHLHWSAVNNTNRPSRAARK